MRDGSHPRYLAWTLRKLDVWEDRGFTEGTDSLSVVAPSGILQLSVKCFGCADLVQEIQVPESAGVANFVIRLDG